MTAMLREIRQLDAARRRGELDEMEYIHAKARLLEAVEDATVEVAPRPEARPRTRPIRRDAGPGAGAQGAIWLALPICLLAAGATTLLGAWLLGDLTLALTLTATLSAAVIVAAFKNLED
ncbi:SHOCT domain-containing protein [Aliishimia ponticola]|uniref:SHOCT domain-containing protein n=1 Tax=Aliishimia ponticola TaxID=2499833 RepID=A0A4S4N7W8_9RHOB|nr:SHOCT domain-containing protein [Aliishimia ponticola]THH35276.1 SHOCT domain-containing protein [Aliishimia ponticola]